MIRDMTGTRLLNPKYIKEIRIQSDCNDVMKSIVAVVEGWTSVLLRQVNTYEMAGAEAYIHRQLEIIEEAMNDGKKQRNVYS